MLKEKKLLYGSILLALVLYLIPLYFGKVWLGLFMLILVGTTFLGMLTKYFNINIESRFLKLGFSAFVFLLVAFHALAFAHDYGRKDFQKELLLQIRQTIEEGITKKVIQEKLIFILGNYHKQDEYSLVELTEQILADNFGENGDFDEHPDQEEPEDATSYYYKLDNDADQVTIIGVSKVVPGKYTEFENYDSSTGMLELKLVLNKRGVSYEVVN